MHKAFTMIELIFVIVIIGILSSIAVPKLSATRDDAKVALVVSNTKHLLQDIIGFYTSQGIEQYEVAKTPDITSIVLYLNPTCRTQATRTQRAFATSSLYLCEDGFPVLFIGTTNPRKPDGTFNSTLSVTFKQIESSHTLSYGLSNNKTFQQLTNGISGKTTLIVGSKVVF